MLAASKWLAEANCANTASRQVLWENQSNKKDQHAGLIPFCWCSPAAGHQRAAPAVWGLAAELQSPCLHPVRRA